MAGPNGSSAAAMTQALEVVSRGKRILAAVMQFSSASLMNALCTTACCYADTNIGGGGDTRWPGGARFT